jgi:hypothetical protein
MFRIIITTLLVGAFFILFFKPRYNLKNKTVPKPEASTTAGFIEDTDDAFINPRFPTPLMKMGCHPSFHYLKDQRMGHNQLGFQCQSPFLILPLFFLSIF